jgi:hypothetical protein
LAKINELRDFLKLDFDFDFSVIDFGGLRIEIGEEKSFFRRRFRTPLGRKSVMRKPRVEMTEIQVLMV